MCLACHAAGSMTHVERRTVDPDAQWLWAELELLRVLGGVAEHPYLVTWRRGELTREDRFALLREARAVFTALGRFYDALDGRRTGGASSPLVKEGVS